MTTPTLPTYTHDFSLRPEAYQPHLFRHFTYYAEPVIWRGALCSDPRGSPDRPLSSTVFKEQLRTEIINRSVRPPSTSAEIGVGGYNRPKD